MEKKINHIKVVPQLAQDIINYLQKKPYEEVFTLISGLMNSVPVHEEEFVPPLEPVRSDKPNKETE